MRTTAPTGADLIRQFTFTDWTTRRCARLRETELWERLDAPDRAALLNIAVGSAPPRI
ncbi:hypothetical protein QM806_27605 [Rhodococcus sp. IEGM 1351]|uniref:hypothetical protein n=1 Tax=Rhodococcus sp. IEGM 1351 TaxID=3047089 RepID=UPI0024B86C52|nr:hypothetical protein [Rhodococcus sp. IEGM 1351]MDI9939157.1 hypothetical protein [Rhodococcus sp. IEGM 1351]